MSKSKSLANAISRLRNRHKELQSALDEELRQRVPNTDVTSTLKREKLRVKDEIAGLERKQRQAALMANPNLCQLPLDELERRHQELKKKIVGLGQKYGPTARVIAEATSELRAVERELARREEDIDPLEGAVNFQKAA